MKNIKFIAEKDIYNLGIKGIYLTIEGMTNTYLDGTLNILDEDLSILINSYSLENLKQDPILLGYRKLHEKVKVSNRKFISSPENLLLNLIKNKTLPSINAIVDIYNLISVKYKIALGAHDMKYISGNVTMRNTIGNELFIPLGQDSPKEVRENLYAYIDDSNEIICLLEVRQVEKTKVTIDTSDCFFIIQGNEETSLNYLKSATDELIFLIKKYCGGKENILLEME